jgi:glucose/arabinose dehydrogenase
MSLRSILLSPLAAFACALVAQAQSPFGFAPFLSGLDRPTALVAVPGQPGRLLVVEQAGRVRSVENGQLEPGLFLNLLGQVSLTSEQGLLDLALHPDFAANGRCFATYTDLAWNLILEEFQAAPQGAVIPGSERRLLTIPKPFVQHNAGKLFFGIDGFLWMATGDGGNAFDPFGNAQDLGSLLGKILRLDVDSAPPAGSPLPYAIPADNPFVGQAGVRPEIYAYGLRNPFRMHQDPLSGDLWIGDVGQNLIEELDRIPAGRSGLNFGWVCKEGPLFTGLCSNPPPGLADPLWSYDHNEGCAIVAGPIYRGAAIPAAWGDGFVADHCTGRIWTFSPAGQTLGPVIEHTASLGGFQGRISGFGEDAAGEVYVIYHQPGKIEKIVPASLVPDCDQDGVPDAAELGQGSAFDLNFDGIPDQCQKLLEVSALQVGQPIQFDFIGAEPGALVVFVAGVRGIGPGPCLPGGSLCLDLIPSPAGSVFGLEILSLQVAGPAGQASFQANVPSSLTLPALYFQVVTVDGLGSHKSNPVGKLTVP